MSRSSLFVFSHPNHELAVYGLAARRRPHLLFLTDGGGEHRLRATRRGLERLGLGDRARFLELPEDDVYRALLDADLETFERLAAAIREQIEETGAGEVFCDAVEHYNPVHDVTLPLVRGALGRRTDVAVFEIPLIHQRRGDAELYRVQRFPPNGDDEVHSLRLTRAELDAKLAARERFYDDLVQQLGSIVTQLPRSHVEIEVWRPAGDPLRGPEGDQRLRYEWRGELLRDEGQIERVIYRERHYLPIARALAE